MHHHEVPHHEALISQRASALRALAALCLGKARRNSERKAKVRAARHVADLQRLAGSDFSVKTERRRHKHGQGHTWRRTSHLSRTNAYRSSARVLISSIFLYEVFIVVILGFHFQHDS